MSYWALSGVYQLVGLHTMGYWALSGVYQLVGLHAMGYLALSGVYQLVGLHTMGYWALSGESISLLVYTQWATGLCQESISVCWSTHNGLLGFVRRVYQFVGLHTMGYWALSGESISLLVYTQWAIGLCQESLSVCWSTHNGLLGFVRRVYQFVGLHPMGYWALSGESISLLVYTQWATGLCQESLSVCWSTHNGLLGFVRRVYQFVGLHTMGYWALSGESISLLVYTQWAIGLCQESLSVCWSTHNGLMGFVRRVYQFVGLHTMG